MAEGHRDRLRSRFTEENIDTIPDYIVLEMMLTGMVSRRNTCETARELINHFGGLAQVIDAPVKELCKIKGVGEAAASYIKLIPLFYRKYQLEKWGKPGVFNTISDACEYLKNVFIGHNNEVLAVLCLDSTGKFLSCRPIIEGSGGAIDINIRKIVEFALSSQAFRVIIAHNHLDGFALPSKEDILATYKIYDALSLVDIKLDDHIIVVPDGDYVSIFQSGFFSPEEEK